jgi:eukaryotic-like serine/threonine-protein kinase
MTDPPEVNRAGLGPLRQIGSGGQGKVYALLDQPDGPVYKEYSPRVVDDLDVDALRRFARFAQELAEPDREALLGRTAWPEVIVRRDGVVRGFLMRRVPPEYTAELMFGAEPTRELASVQFLLNPPAYLRERGLRVDDVFRLEFLRDTAEALALLHRLGISVGDLSPNNLLFGLTSRPRCFFIDCDTMCLSGESVLPQAETPDWRVSAIGDEEPGTPASDAYKFGLLVARLFAADQQTTSAATVPPSLRRHVLSCLSTEPDERRTPGEWLDPLDRQLRRTSKRRGDTQEPAEPSAPRTAGANRAAGAKRAAAAPVAPPSARPAWPWVAVPALVLTVLMAIASNDSDPSSPIPPGRLPTPNYTPLFTPPLYTPPVYTPPRIEIPQLTVPLPTVPLVPLSPAPGQLPPLNGVPKVPAPQPVPTLPAP